MQKTAFKWATNPVCARRAKIHSMIYPYESAEKIAVGEAERKHISWALNVVYGNIKVP